VHVCIAIFANGREVYDSANRPGRVGQGDLLAMQLLDRALDFGGVILCAMNEREAGNCALRRRAIFKVMSESKMALPSALWPVIMRRVVGSDSVAMGKGGWCLEMYLETATSRSESRERKCMINV
jgi:hypothetical protein